MLRECIVVVYIVCRSMVTGPLYVLGSFARVCKRSVFFILYILNRKVCRLMTVLDQYQYSSDGSHGGFDSPAARRYQERLSMI